MPVVIVIALALGLYLPFLSIQYDTNGIVEAASIESGALLSKNHMLYRPVGLFVWRASRLAGYTGPSLIVLQMINAITGAIGVGLAYLAFLRIGGSRSVAAIGALFLGSSFSWWVTATDVFYITMAAMFAAASLACMVHARSLKWIAAAGVFTAASIFTWQASLFLIPAMLFLLPADLPKARSAVVFVLTAVLLAGTVYFTVAVASQGFLGPQELWTVHALQRQEQFAWVLHLASGPDTDRCGDGARQHSRGQTCGGIS